MIQTHILKAKSTNDSLPSITSRNTKSVENPLGSMFFSLLRHSVITHILWGSALHFCPRICSCTPNLFRFACMISLVSFEILLLSFFSYFSSLIISFLANSFCLLRFPSCLGMSTSSRFLISILFLIHAFVDLRLFTLLSSSELSNFFPLFTTSHGVAETLPTFPLPQASWISRM